MKYLKTYQLFEAVDINIPSKDYIEMLCEKAKVIFSEDDDSLTSEKTGLLDTKIK